MLKLSRAETHKRTSLDVFTRVVMKLQGALGSLVPHHFLGWRASRCTSSSGPSSASPPMFSDSWTHLWDSCSRLAAIARSSSTSEAGARRSRLCGPGSSCGPAWIQLCHVTAHNPEIHCSTGLCQRTFARSHPQPNTHVVIIVTLLGLTEHVRHASDNPRRCNTSMLTGFPGPS